MAIKYEDLKLKNIYYDEFLSDFVMLDKVVVTGSIDSNLVYMTKSNGETDCTYMDRVLKNFNIIDENIVSKWKQDKLKNTSDDEGIESFLIAISQLMEEFNFERVATVMKALDWGWVGPAGTPDIHEIKSEVRKSFIGMYRKGMNYMATGGFEYNLEKEDGEYFLKLRFIAEEWDNYD